MSPYETGMNIFYENQKNKELITNDNKADISKNIIIQLENDGNYFTDLNQYDFASEIYNVNNNEAYIDNIIYEILEKKQQYK